MLDLSAHWGLIEHIAGHADYDTLLVLRHVSEEFNKAADVALCRDFTFYLDPKWCNVLTPKRHPAFYRLWIAATWWSTLSAGEYLPQDEFDLIGDETLAALPHRIKYLLVRARVLHVNMWHIAAPLAEWLSKTVGHVEVARYSRLQERHFLRKRFSDDAVFPATSAHTAVIFCWGWRNIGYFWCKYADETDEFYPYLPKGTRRVVYNVASVRTSNPELFSLAPPPSLQEVVLLFSYSTPYLGAPYVDMSDRGPRAVVDTALEYALAHRLKLTIANPFAIPKGTWAPRNAEGNISWSGWDECNITLGEYVRAWFHDKGAHDAVNVVTILSLAEYAEFVGERQFQIEWFQEPE